MRFQEEILYPHGMHKCIIEEDFPGAIVEEMEYGVADAYYTDNY